MEAFLNSVLRGLIQYSLGIYILLVLGILVFLRKLLIGLTEWRKAVFGLEKDIAQRKLVSASTGLTLVVLLLVGEFLLVTVVGPQMPAAPVQATPTIDPLATPTSTLSETAARTQTPGSPPSQGQESLESECVEGQVNITFPENGGTVSGTVELIGSVNIENFGSFKYEFSTTGTINWITIAAGNTVRLDESLGFWYTSSLTPGDYLLRLVPMDNTGAEETPCVIGVEVVPEE
jgi:hypothetical protein